MGREVLEELAVWAQAAEPADVAHSGAVSRRALLGGAAATLPVLVTGCRGIQVLGKPPPPAPDVVALRQAISAEKLMVARYTSVLRLPPSQLPAGLEAALRAVQAEHVEHLAHLKARLIEPAGSAPAPSPSPSPSATTSLTGGVSAEVLALEQAEQAASNDLIGHLAVLPPSLAQLFASIAASEATHVPYLQAARRGR